MLSSKLSNSTTLETKNIWKKKRKVDKKEEDIKDLEFDVSKEEQIMATTPGILDESLPDDIINITTTLSQNNEKQIINKNNLLKLNFNKKKNNPDKIYLIVNVKNNENINENENKQNEKTNNNNELINNYEKIKKYFFFIIIFLSCLIILIIFGLIYNNIK